MSGSKFFFPTLARAKGAAASHVSALSAAAIRTSPLAQPVPSQALPRQSSALAARPSSELVPHGHKFVDIQDTHRTGMQPDTITHTVIPKGTRLAQMQVTGGWQGAWYSPVFNQTPQQSGISPFGMQRVIEMGPGTPLPPTQLAHGQGVMLPGGESWGLARKQPKFYEALTNVPAVFSVAKPIVDTWSGKLPEGKAPLERYAVHSGRRSEDSPAVHFSASGGGQQLLSPLRSHFREVSDASPAPTVQTLGDKKN